MQTTCRRYFLRQALKGGAAALSLGLLPFSNHSSYVLRARPAKEALFYQKLEGNTVQCRLCPNVCMISAGQSGFCRVRKNIGGRLHSMVYGRPCTIDVGPIEKAPLFHFLPGHQRLCVATVGCNLRCLYCQNWHISQKGPGEVKEWNMSAQGIVEEARRRGVNSISFTYSEPTVFYEYVYDISKLARERGVKTSIVSNGYINPQPLRDLLPYLDAVKIDLKGFSEEFYREVSSARLEPVLQTLKVLQEEKAHFEIVNLVVPTLNDDPAVIEKMCLWIKGHLGEDTPLHFSRFHPTYRLTNLPATPVRTLDAAIRIARDTGLRYVYIGNVPGHRHNSTYCPRCEERLIHRVHFSVLRNNLAQGRCKFCGHRIHGIWE
ncbi:MAG TPA: AmmeMemoRadiSam system radical SAM enzyme [Acidobacteriota bacterium]|nr:AmmeMemoRadiSam system radical SAM enzyme [Acidobacteriota bacterium]